MSREVAVDLIRAARWSGTLSFLTAVRLAGGTTGAVAAERTCVVVVLFTGRQIAVAGESIGPGRSGRELGAELAVAPVLVRTRERGKDRERRDRNEKTIWHTLSVRGGDPFHSKIVRDRSALAQNFPGLVYSTPVRRAVLVLALALCACRSSYWAMRGDERLKEKNYPVAIADYDAALNQSGELDESTRDAITAKRSEAAAQLADLVLVQVDQYVHAQQYDAAIQQVASVLASNGFGVDAVRQRMRAALDELLIQRIERLNAESHERYLNTMMIAEWLENIAPDSAVVKEQIAFLRARAIDFHLGLAKGAPPEARLFHLRVAQRFGAQGLEQELAKLTGDTSVVQRADYEVVAPSRVPNAECKAFIDRLKERMPRSPGGVQIRVHLTLEKCAHREEQWSKSDVFTYPSWESYNETLEEKYYATNAEKCPEPACARFDQLGVCVEHAKAESCDGAQPELRSRSTPVTRFRTTTSTLAADVRHRRLASGVKGALLLDYAGQKLSSPFDQLLALEEQEVWTPAQTYRFSATKLDDLADQVAKSAIVQVTNQATYFRPMLLNQLTAEAEKYRVQGANAKYEALLVAATLTGGYPPPAAQQYFAAVYGLNPQQMNGLLYGQLPRNTSAATPYYYNQPDYNDDRYIPVETHKRARGASIQIGSGMDFFAATETSPLNTATWFESLGVRIRAERFQLSLEGRTPALAGDSSGFAASFRVVFGRKWFLLASGIGWENERAESGERRYFFGLPISAMISLAKPLTLEIRADLNALAFKSRDDASDPHFYSPLSVRMEIDLDGRFYFTGVARHYLGAGKHQLLDGGLELGLRL